MTTASLTNHGTTKIQTLHEVIVPGKRLGRHVKHDPRSFLFHAPMAAAIHSVEHVRHVPIFDQGDLGMCTCAAADGCISTGPFTHKGTIEEARNFYSEATRIDPFAGQWPPDDTGSNGLSAMKVLKNHNLIRSYTHVFDVNAFLRALVLRPGIIGTNWLTGMDSPDAHGVVRYSGAYRGGHEYCAVAIDAQKKLVKFANSWGTGFGLTGYFFMSWDDVAKALADSGDATFPLI